MISGVKFYNLNIKANNNVYFGAKQTPSKLFGLKSDVFERSAVSFCGEQKTQPSKDSIYKDPDKFAPYFSEKLYKELLVKDEKYVDNVIKNVCLNTGASEQTAREVVSRLSQFSSYSQVLNLAEEIKNKGINNILNFLPGRNIYEDFTSASVYGQDLPSTCQNEVLRYVGIQKEQFQVTNDRWFWYDPNDELNCYIIDKSLLNGFKAIKEKDPDGFECCMQYLDDTDVKFFVVDGWNTKIDDKYCSYGMLYKNMSLDKLAIEVIHKMQNDNLTLDEAINGDIISEAKEILGKDKQIDILKNNDLGSNSSISIAKRMAPVMPQQEQVEQAIKETIQKNSSLEAEEQEGAYAILRKYLDSEFMALSSDNLNEEVKEIHKKIQEQVEKYGKTMRQVVYLVPTKGKSFSLIANQYKEVNNIPDEQFISALNKDEVKNKVVVILDDYVGSGDSLMRQQFSYSYYTLDTGTLDNSNLIFAPLVMEKTGRDNINREITLNQRRQKDCVITNHFIDYGKFVDSLSEEELELYKQALKSESTYKGIASCIVMPYMIPDTNVTLGIKLGEKLMPNKVVPKNLEAYIKLKQSFRIGQQTQQD